MSASSSTLLDHLLASSTSFLLYGADIRTPLDRLRTRLAGALIFDARSGAAADRNLSHFLAAAERADAPLVVLLAEDVPDGLRAGLRDALDAGRRVLALSPTRPPASTAGLFGSVVAVEAVLRSPKLRAS